MKFKSNGNKSAIDLKWKLHWVLFYVIEVKFNGMHYRLCFPLTLQGLGNLLKKKKQQ